MKHLSIRWRLTLWYAGALAIVLTTFCLILLFLTRQQLMARTDAALREELRELALEVQLAADRGELKKHVDVRFFRHDVYDFLIVNEQGEIVFASSGISPGHVTVLVPLTASDTIEIFDRQIPGGAMIRVAGKSASGPLGNVTAMALTSLSPLHADMLTLQLLMIVLLPLSVVLALSGGYFLAARALAPVDQIARVAETITISNLHQRIEVVNSQDELGRLAGTLNSLIARLERAVDEIQRFTADASHELRTPLAVLRAEAESALRMRRAPEEYERTLTTVVEEATRLGRLADQLLNLSRHDAGIIDCRRDPVRLDALLLDVVEQMRPMADDRGIVLNEAGISLAEIRGDDLLLGQALFNVIENAIKYTPRGGHVSVQCETLGENALLRVSDTGIGIPREHLGRVFDRFYRVDPFRHCGTGGAGLGLAITRSTIQMHGGEIEIQSDVGLGTTLIIRLPGVASDRWPRSREEFPIPASNIAAQGVSQSY